MPIMLPSGLPMFYHGLTSEKGERGPEYTYRTRKGPSRIYGGKVGGERVPSCCTVYHRAPNDTTCQEVQRLC